MTRLALVAKKSLSSGRLAISSRAFSQLNKCPNSKWGLGMSDLEEVKNLVNKFEQDLKTIKNRGKKSSACADCKATHLIVENLIMDLLYPGSKTLLNTVPEAIKKVSLAEAKLVANRLKSDLAFNGIPWKDLF